MGYTVYWKWKGTRPIWPSRLHEIQLAVDVVFRKALANIKTDSGRTLLQVSERCLETQRREPEYEACFHETFFGSDLTMAKFGFCKTARKPYDKAVKLALIEAQRLSDNAWDITCDEGGAYTKDTALVLGPHDTWLPEECVKARGETHGERAAA